jgi:TPR repeat protein
MSDERCAMSDAACSPARSLDSLKARADASNSDARFSHTIQVANCDGAEQNKSFAAHSSRPAADQGNAKAQFNYGFVLDHCDGVPMGNAKVLAVECSKLSTDQGNVKAQCNYGALLFTGDGDGDGDANRVVMDKELAVHYFELAADQGAKADGQCESALQLCVAYRT